jgi:hypothetical protein
VQRAAESGDFSGARKAVLQKFENDINFTERKWISLKETPRPINLPEDIDAPIT